MLTPSAKEEAYSGPGKEPLLISQPEFAALFKGRKTPIKAALLNQSLLHGVGNIYADESLFRAGIRPRRQAGRLTRAELGRLRKALIEVLRHAIKLGGSSVSDYVDADGVRGFFQLQHKVYMRTGQPCLVCGRRPSDPHHLHFAQRRALGRKVSDEFSYRSVAGTTARSIVRATKLIGGGRPALNRSKSPASCGGYRADRPKRTV